MWFVVSLTWTFPPISKYFDSQGMAASRAAHLPHILRASRQGAAAARHNAACRRVFCALNLEHKLKVCHSQNTAVAYRYGIIGISRTCFAISSGEIP